MATITTVPYADWPDNVKAAVRGTEDGVAGWGGKVFTVRRVTIGDVTPLSASDVGLPAGSRIGKVLTHRFRRQSWWGGPVQAVPVRWDSGRQALVTDGAYQDTRTVSPVLAGIVGIATFIAA